MQFTELKNLESVTPEIMEELTGGRDIYELNLDGFKIGILIENVEGYKR